MPAHNGAGAILLNLQMIQDPMDELLWNYTSHRPDEEPVLSGCLLYCGQENLQEDILYLIPEELENSFPADRFSYAACGDLQGLAPHLRCISSTFPQVCNSIMSTFRRYHEFENGLNAIITRGGSITDLCNAGNEFFRNPVYIHDHMFSIIGRSNHVVGMLDFEYNSKTGKEYIPLWLINEFKFDEAYRSTLALRSAGIWGNDQYPFNIRSLFVNLFEGEQYRGRLLINEIGTSLQLGQRWAAEYFAQCAITLLRNQRLAFSRHYHNFEETLIDLAEGGTADPRDLTTMLTILGWKDNDRFLCIKLQSQDSAISIQSGSALSSHLNVLLKEYVDFLHQQQMCIVLNLTRSELTPPAVRRMLAPHVRDGYLFGAISNPIRGITNISTAFRQAEIVLDFLSRENKGTWLASYSHCALEDIRSRVCNDLPCGIVVHPILRELKDFDAENGTQYYDTLRAYLVYERDIAKASESLFIHRTTLTYRLGKIKELIHVNLEDPNQRLYLLLSFYMFDREQE